MALDVVRNGPAEPREPVSIYAARDKMRHIVTVMVVNKSALARTVRFTFKGIALAMGKGYSIDAATNGIQVLIPAPVVQGETVQQVFAPRSICHLRFPENP